MRILALCPHYLPGVKAGGPVRSIANLVERLGEEFDFLVITYDHDFTEKQPYPGIRSGEWQTVGKAQVLYLPDREFLPWRLARHLRRADHDLIYLNSFFHPTATIGVLLLRRLRAIPHVPFVLAPRGEFSLSALQLKPIRKWLYLRIGRLLRLFVHLLWQASSDFERADIYRAVGERNAVVVTHVAPDLSSLKAPAQAAKNRPPKRPGQLRVIFAGRVAPMKNLDYAIRQLQGVRGEVEMTVLGPLEDEATVAAVREAMAQLPAEIRVELRGAVSHDEVLAEMAQHHLFLFPTRGENFGHVILEAMSAGCPVVISDRTPWRNLEEVDAGYDLPLENPERFTQVIQSFVDMDEETWTRHSSAALSYIRLVLGDEKALDLNRRLFREAESILETHDEKHPPVGVG